MVEGQELAQVAILEGPQVADVARVSGDAHIGDGGLSRGGDAGGRRQALVERRALELTALQQLQQLGVEVEPDVVAGAGLGQPAPPAEEALDGDSQALGPIAAAPGAAELHR